MAHWKPVSEWQQLHVHVGVSCLLQHALGLHSILRHLYELELDHGGVPEPDSGTTVEEVEVEDQEVMHATALDHCYQSLAGRFSGGPRGKKKKGLWSFTVFVGVGVSLPNFVIFVYQAFNVMVMMVVSKFVVQGQAGGWAWNLSWVKKNRNGKPLYLGLPRLPAHTCFILPDIIRPRLCRYRCYVETSAELKVE